MKRTCGSDASSDRCSSLGSSAQRPACFAFDEIDKAGALDNSFVSGGAKPAAAPGGANAGAAKPAAAKPGAGADAAAQPAAPSERAWWQTARSLGSEESDEGITRFELSGRAEFMLRDDCLARAGVPK
jgi:hypothetical protein